MNQNHMILAPFFPLTNLFMIIITFFLLAKRALCAIDPYFLACKPRTCGDGQNITFPFYIEGEQEPFCGYPGFHLFCDSNGKPILKLSNNDFVIHRIFYKNQSILVSNAAVFDTNATCTPPIRNISLPDDRFRFLPNQRDLFLLYNCNRTLTLEDSRLSRYNVDCLSDGGEAGPTTTLAILDSDPLLGYASNGCQNGVVAPVDLYRGADDGFQGLLRGGFLLNWIASDCSVCQGSGGKCGFENATYYFNCYCPDRPHFKSCNDTGTGTSRIIKIAAIAIAVAGISMFAILAFYCRNKLSSDDLFSWIKKSEDDEKIEAFLRNFGPLALRRFSFMDIKKMTKSFNEKLGQGGFGSVYKGKLPDGRDVAVKVLVKSKGNGEEFINEVASISRTSHVNIVTLLGFCFQGSKRALIYEFMPNGSLERYINEGNPLKPNRQLGWETLYKIAVGIARGLEYLHRDCNTRILHFDIKPHNILLDENLSPKICDFGLSKICPRKESIVSMEGARGTAGYIAPEVFSRNFGPVSPKSDVYSYGMLVLEMVGGRRNISVEVDHTSEIYFPHWICKRIELAEELGLHGIGNDDENRKARQLILVSLWCIQTDPANRPPMRRVIEMLQGDLGSIPIPPRPYLSSPSRSPPKSIVDSSTTPILNL